MIINCLSSLLPIDQMDLATLNQLVNRLQNDNQSISVGMMETLTRKADANVSCYAGLLSIAYSMLLSTQSAQQIMQLQQFLKLQGDILCNFSKLLTLPKPAIHLAQFDYPALELASSKNGSFRQILRHSKGLCPQYDPNQFPTLHFLPFYREIAGRQAQCQFLLGNRTWKTAVTVMKHFYWNKLRKSNRVQWDDELQSETNGLLLCYVILLRSQDGINEYISMLNRLKESDTRVNISQQVCYLQYWFTNYVSLVENGLKMYTKTLKSIDNLQLLTQIPSNSHKDSIQFQMLQLIRQIFSHKIVQQSAVCKLIRQVNEISCSESYKYLLLALLYKIEGKVRVSRPLAKTCYQMYQTDDQFFNRVFYSDVEIIEKCREGCLQLPVNFRYSPSLQKTITEICFVRDPIRYIHQAESQCSEEFILTKLISDDRIGKTELDSSISVGQEHRSAGQSYGSCLIELIENRVQTIPVQHLYSQTTYQYLPIWKEYHNYISHGSPLPQLKHLLQKCQQKYASSTTSKTIHHKLHENKYAVTHILKEIHDQTCKLLTEMNNEILKQLTQIVNNGYVEKFMMSNELLANNQQWQDSVTQIKQLAQAIKEGESYKEASHLQSDKHEKGSHGNCQQMIIE